MSTILFQVPGLHVYGLFAVSDLAVSEQYLVKYIVYYNDKCARKYHLYVGPNHHKSELKLF